MLSLYCCLDDAIVHLQTYAAVNLNRNELFSKAAQLSNHVLHELLPPLSTASQQYNLRTHYSYLNTTHTYLIVAF